MCSDFYVAIYAITQQHNLSLTLPFSSLFIAHSHKGRFCFTGHAANKACAPQMSTSVSCRWRSSQVRAEKMSAVKLNCSLTNWLNSPQCQTIKRFRKYLDSPHVNACYSSRIHSWSANSSRSGRAQGTTCDMIKSCVWKCFITKIKVDILKKNSFMLEALWNPTKVSS